LADAGPLEEGSGGWRPAPLVCPWARTLVLAPLPEEGELANVAVASGNGGEGIDKEPREENEALGEDAFAESGHVEVDGNDAANAAIVDAESAREE